MANIRGAPKRSDAQPATIRPTGAIQIAELASRPRSLMVRWYLAAMLGLNAAVENHIRKHQKKPTVAMMSCSTLCVRIAPAPGFPNVRPLIASVEFAHRLA